jgi:hypothetical protein
MTPIDYLMQVPGGNYTIPDNPGPTTEIPDGASTVQANVMVQEHTELLNC